MGKLKVLIIDDHILIRETWSKLLSIYPDFEVVGNTGDHEVAVEAARSLKPDIVLLDINMSPVSGFDILAMILRFSPGSKVVGVSMHSQPAYAKKMLRGGAKGYVTKNSTSNELIEAIRHVAEGNIYICSEVKNIISKTEIEEPDHSSGSLTARELEIISLIKTGLSSKEIGQQLHISQKTVEVHRHNILRKLDVKNSAELINYANRHSIV